MEPNLTRLSYYDYRARQQAEVVLVDTPFYSLVAVLMGRADTDNLELLKTAFPNIWADLKARYHAPGGLLEGER